jgi:hypothetical protein
MLPLIGTVFRSSPPSRAAYNVNGVVSTPSSVEDRAIEFESAADMGTDGQDCPGGYLVEDRVGFDVGGFQVHRVEGGAAEIEFAANGCAYGPDRSGHGHRTGERAAFDVGAIQDQIPCPTVFAEARSLQIEFAADVDTDGLDRASRGQTTENRGAIDFGEVQVQRRPDLVAKTRAVQIELAADLRRLEY